jgi:hypothetical protein
MPALQDLSAILGVLAQNVRPTVVRTYNRRSTLLRTLRIDQGEGKNVAWDLESDAAVAETFADGDEVTNFGVDGLFQATLPWGLYRSNFKVGDLARAAAKSSRTPTGLLRLWARNLVNAITKNASTINKALFAGGGANSIIGLDTALDDSNTYAGVDRTQPASTGFRASVIDPGQPTVTGIASVRDDLRQVFEKSGVQPDIAICSPALYNRLGAQFDDSRRRVQDITTARGQVHLDGSVGGIEIDGCVFMRDKDATPGRIYYLNTDAVHIEYLPQDTDVEVPGTTQEQTEDGFGTVPLGMVAEPLAKTGDAMKAHVKVFLQLVVEAPHMCALRKNASAT